MEFTEADIYSDEFDSDIKRLIANDYYFDLPTCYMIKKSQSNRRRKVFKFKDKDKIILPPLCGLVDGRLNGIY